MSAKVKVLVPVSGGKDSQASLKLALENNEKHEVRGLFCDTNFEHPVTYQHIEFMRELYGVQIDVVSGGSVLEKTMKYKRFPGGGARHCTDELKIRETKIYCKDLAAKQGGFEVWYGMRSSESPERRKRYAGKVCDELYAPHEVLPNKYPQYLAKMGVQFRLCILNWSIADVIFYVGAEYINPLYADGFDRVGCFPCLAAGDEAKRKAFEYDEFGRSQHWKVMIVSAQIGKSIWTSKGGIAMNAERICCLLCSI